MKFIPQEVPEVFLIIPKVFGDARGYFCETFRQDLFEKAIGYKVNFVQDNESMSARGVLRGLHFQTPPFAQSKLVRVIEGRVLDVAVDIRQGSKTYGKSVLMELSGENKHQAYIPRGFAHGFVVLSNTAIFAYKVDNTYSPECDRGLAFDDKDLAIDWQLPVSELKLSEKDQKQPGLSELAPCFDNKVNYYE